MIQKPKGTYDTYGDYGKKLLKLEEILKMVMEKYNYEYFKTPIFESSNLFHRGVGEQTDIVSKETYDFKDRGNRDMTLRPEGTAGIVRSVIENKLYATKPLPIKAWYMGSMYRYERPQSGRFREFNQFGIEVFGCDDAIMDAEVIMIATNILRILGLDKIVVKLNSLGDDESRDNYRNALLDYFKPHLDDLCSDCVQRYSKNPLRILDCKVDKDKPFMKDAPVITDYLNEESKKHLEKVIEYLDSNDIKYQLDPKIVRGLDYYTHTVFEVEANIKGFNGQTTLCGGGRYNHLVENLEGPSLSGVGYAMGIERLMEALDHENINLINLESELIYVIPLSSNEIKQSFKITEFLRLNGFTTEIDYMNRNIKNNFKHSEKIKARLLILIGEDELKENILTVKDNKTKEEYKVKTDEIVHFLDHMLDNCDCH